MGPSEAPFALPHLSSSPFRTEQPAGGLGRAQEAHPPPARNLNPDQPQEQPGLNAADVKLKKKNKRERKAAARARAAAQNQALAGPAPDA